jgi:hypothetical protein
MRHPNPSRRWSVIVVVAALSAGAGLAASVSSADSGNTLTPDQPQLSWTNGPLTATSSDVAIGIDVPAGYWTASPGGLVVRIDTGTADAELDLAVTDTEGTTLAASRYGARSYQQVYLPRPPNGDYVVSVHGPAVAPGPGFTATAELVTWSSPQASYSDATMQFERTTVDPQILANEPGIALDPKGPIYVSAPNGFNNATSALWRSDDGAQTFREVGVTKAAGIADPRRRPCGASSGGGDIDVTVDRTGRVYFADLEDFAISAGYSTDHGKTWSCNPLEGLPLGNERPWIAAAPTADGVGSQVDAYMAFDDLISGQLSGTSHVVPQQMHVLVTVDGGQTWTAGGTFGAGLVPIPGPLFVGPTGNVYNVFSGLDAVWLAESTDEGQTFTVTKISQRLSDPRGNGNGWTVGAVDGAGNLYATWIDGGTGDVLYTRSEDDGFNWSAPVRINPVAQVAIRPWIAAGTDNDVVISWYGAAGDFLPGPGAPDGTKWFPYVARNTIANDPLAPWTLAKMSPTPVLVGFGDNIDVGSVAADVFKVAIGQDGQVFASFCNSGRVQSVAPIEVAPTVYNAVLNAPPQPQPYVVVARQTDGVGMATATPSIGKPYRGPKALDFISTPAITRTADTTTVQFKLASADLTGAFDVEGLAATDAYWLVLFRTGGRQEYVGVRRSRHGPTTFFGGTEPAAGVYPSTDECCATYPSALPLTGHLDTSSGTVTITAPLSALHLKAGKRVYDVQAFSLIGRPASRTRFNLLDEADVTPASTQTLN